MTTRRTVFFRSKPQLYVIAPVTDAHRCTIRDWIVRETWEEADKSEDRGLPSGTIRYSIVIEAEVSSSEQIWAMRAEGHELADDLNRIWTYVCGQPLNAARLQLVKWSAPPTWESNIEEVDHELQVAASGLVGTLSILTRHWAYISELPLAKALGVWRSYRRAAEPIRTLIELHYLALTSERSQARLFFLAKALELVRALLPGDRDDEKQRSLPADITDGLDQSLHWLFEMANNRSDVRHVVRRNTATLHPRMTDQETRSFEHDGDLICRTVVCQRLGHDPFLIEQKKTAPDSG